MCMSVCWVLWLCCSHVACRKATFVYASSRVYTGEYCDGRVSCVYVCCVCVNFVYVRMYACAETRLWWNVLARQDSVQSKRPQWWCNLTSLQITWPQGYWEDDDRSGEGELTYNTGELYKGMWRDDKQSKPMCMSIMVIEKVIS